MATTNLGLTGSELLTEKRVVRAITDDSNVLEMRLTITVDSVDYVFEQLPDIGTTNEFTFEINSFLRNLVVSQLKVLNSGSVASNSVVFFSYVFQGLNALAVPIMGEDTTSESAFGYNYSQNDLNPINLTTYNNNIGDATSLLLTDFLNPRKVLLNGFVSLSSRVIGNSQRWFVIFTDELDNIAYTDIISPVGDNDVALLKYGSTLVYEFNQPTATKMNIFIADSGGSGFSRTFRSRIYTFEKVAEPCQYVEVLWINQFGAMEITLFNSNFAFGTQINKKSFEKVRPVNPTSYDRGQNNYMVESVKRFTIWSDYEKMEDIEKLNYISVSPQVAVKIGAQIIPVIVENATTEDYNYHEPINRVTFNMVMANKRINVV
jgi:hypothetical protein